MTVVCTIGYEGFGSSEWMSTLVDSGIQAVVDVRAVPLSRKRGFSKNQLAQALGSVGIEYVPAQALGNPRVYRDALRDGLDFQTFAGMFSVVLDEQGGALEAVLQRADGQRVCLLCYEEDPDRCHRSLVAERLRAMRPEVIQVLHLRNEHAA